MTSAVAELLGQPRALAGTRWVDFLPDKRFQLLAFLADAGGWVRRDELSYLFWPDVPTDRAQNSLRQAFKRLRLLGFPGKALESDRFRVRWLVDTDVARFSGAVAAGDHGTALESYRGAFLKGLDTGESNEFHAWLEFKRQQLFGQWRDSVRHRVAELRDLGDREGAVHLQSTLLVEDPLDEHALQELLSMCVSHGQVEIGIHAFEEFEAKLEVELSLVPSSGTIALAQELRRISASARERGRGNKAVTARSLTRTTFFGRKRELERLDEMVRRDDCRLVVLVGAGGVGKSRIAMEAMPRLATQLAAEATYVPLDAVASHFAIPAAVADALGFDLGPQGHPLTQLAKGLGSKKLLLVLDNFEHLLPGVPMLVELLSSCPGIKMLVTSRARLGITNEWVMEIDGLPYPEQLTGEADQYDSVRLFIERSQRISQGSEVGAQAAADICRLVQGHPLAIELAAAWTRIMPAAEIAREIEANLDFLDSDLLDLPSRQRSVRAVFEHSWKTLTTGEQDALSKLAVFRGGFTRDAASLVMGCPLAILAALADKSLLRVDSTGRFDFHPLLQSFAYDKLSGPERDAAREGHGRYFLRTLRGLNGPAGQVAKKHSRDTGEEMSNVVEAWRWAVETLELDEIQGSAKLLVNLLRGRLQDAIELLETALEAVAALEEGQDRDERELELQIALGPALMATKGFAHPDVERAYGKAWQLAGELAPSPSWFPVLWGQWVYYTTGADNERGMELGDRLLRLARRAGNDEMLLEAHHALWTTFLALGSFDAARRHIASGLDLYEAERHHHLATSYGGHDAGVCSLAFSGPVLWSLGLPDQALEQSRRSLSLARGLEHPMSQIMASYWLSMLHQLRREPREAQEQAAAANALAREHGNAMFAAWSACITGWAVCSLGEPDEGIERIRQGLEDYRATGAGMYQTHVLAMLAEACLQAGRFVEAESVLQEALQLCQRTKEGHHLAEIHRLFGELRVRTKRFEDAESSFRESRAISRRQRAKGWELRALTSMARLDQVAGREGPAAAQLEATYGWFTEGHSTFDLLSAKELLDSTA